MRLIDADELTKNMMQYVRGQKTIGRIIDEQPTAYDVDEVLNQIKVFYPQNDQIPDTPQALGYLICCSEQYKRLWKIIKRGGIHEN